MSTAREIEDAILSLPATEPDKLLHSIPNLFRDWAGMPTGNASSRMNARVALLPSYSTRQKQNIAVIRVTKNID
jgi:hypothetical protein